mgnify:CR=1 FL=1
MKSTDFEIHNRIKLDKILVELCQLVIDGQAKDSEKYGMVAACVLDPDNRAVAALNYKIGKKDVHGERAARRGREPEEGRDGGRVVGDRRRGRSW